MSGRKVISNIKSLLNIGQSAFGLDRPAVCQLARIDDAWLSIENGIITGYGSMNEFQENSVGNNAELIDVSGCYVLPSWCDSHTHIVYAGNRVNEFVDRINGLSYAEIAAKGGGILNSARLLQKTSEEELFESSLQRLLNCIDYGTGAIEIKSGYGLTIEAELKMLRVIRRLREASPIPVVATFLAAHAIPDEFKGNIDGFVDEVVKNYIPKVAQEGLADFVDVFCETGYFSPDHTNRILEQAGNFGLQPKIHVNQFSIIGGVQVGVSHNARSVDHLELLASADIDSLRSSSTIPVALPACSLYLDIPYTPARSLLDAGIPLALATDFNPGSAPSGNMNLVNSLACMKMRMRPDEVIMASTINGAYAMGLSHVMGSIEVGKRASLIITQPMQDYSEMMYHFGDNPVSRMIL